MQIIKNIISAPLDFTIPFRYGKGTYYESNNLIEFNGDQSEVKFVGYFNKGDNFIINNIKLLLDSSFKLASVVEGVPEDFSFNIFVSEITEPFNWLPVNEGAIKFLDANVDCKSDIFIPVSNYVQNNFALGVRLSNNAGESNLKIDLRDKLAIPFVSPFVFHDDSGTPGIPTIDIIPLKGFDENFNLIVNTGENGICATEGIYFVSDSSLVNPAYNTKPAMVFQLNYGDKNANAVLNLPITEVDIPAFCKLQLRKYIYGDTNTIFDANCANYIKPFNSDDITYITYDATKYPYDYPYNNFAGNHIAKIILDISHTFAMLP